MWSDRVFSFAEENVIKNDGFNYHGWLYICLRAPSQIQNFKVLQKIPIRIIKNSLSSEVSSAIQVDLF